MDPYGRDIRGHYVTEAPRGTKLEPFVQQFPPQIRGGGDLSVSTQGNDRDAIAGAPPNGFFAGYQPGPLMWSKQIHARIGQRRMGQQQDIGQRLVQATAQRANHKDLSTNHFRGMNERQLEIRFIFFRRVPQNLDSIAFELGLPFGRQGVEVTDQDIGQRIQGQKMAQAAICGNDNGGLPQVVSPPLSRLYVSIGYYQNH